MIKSEEGKRRKGSAGTAENAVGGEVRRGQRSKGSGESTGEEGAERALIVATGSK